MRGKHWWPVALSASGVTLWVRAWYPWTWQAAWDSCKPAPSWAPYEGE